MSNRYLTFLIVAVIVTIVGMGYFMVKQNNFVNSRITQIQALVQKNTVDTQSFAKQISSSTQNQIAPLQQYLKNQQNSPKPTAKSQTIAQAPTLTSVVARVAPAVVSIVISKNVPQLEVVYINPFGDDPAYKDIGIRIPVYRQKGTAVQKVGAGSGFIVSSNGYIVTNNHVVSDTQAQYTVLLSDGSQKVAQVVFRAADKDAAVIKIDGLYSSVLSLGDSSSLSLGQSVIAIGNALGEYSNSVSVGIVSGLNRSIDASDANTGEVETLSGVIQTDAAINPGNSGGPLLDANGSVIGINVATVAGSNSIGFAIPINSVKSQIQNVVK